MKMYILTDKIKLELKSNKIGIEIVISVSMLGLVMREYNLLVSLLL